MLKERIKELRTANGISQLELGKKVSLTQQAIAKWEKGIAEPDSETIAKLADFFGVTTDFLIGKSDIPQPVQYRNESEENLDDDSHFLLRGIKKMTPEERKRARVIFRAAFERHYIDEE